MPYASPHLCNQPGCNKLTHKRFCDGHTRSYRALQDKKRGTAHQRGYGGRWRKVREAHLKENPLCVECSKQNKVTAAIIVDHIVPHKMNYELMWDPNNHQSLCKYHHDKKTATQDGGFGR